MKTTRILIAALLASLLIARAPAQSPEAAAAHQAGQALLKEKKPKEAAAEFEKAAKLAPDNADYHADYGRALSAQMADANFMQKAMLSGKMKKAFDRAVELNPNHVGGLIGQIRFYSGAPEIAGGSMEKAAATAAHLKTVLPFMGEFELGGLAERAEDYAKALGHYEAAVRLNPQHPGAQNACGRMLVKLGKADDARARFEAALKLNPDFEPAKKALAELGAPTAKS